MLLAPTVIDETHLTITQPNPAQPRFILEISNILHPNIRAFAERVKAENPSCIEVKIDKIFISFVTLEDLNNLRAEMHYAAWTQDKTLQPALYNLCQYCLYAYLKRSNFNQPISSLESTAYQSACEHYRHDLSMLWFFENNSDYPHSSFERNEAEDKLFSQTLIDMNKFESLAKLAKYSKWAISPSAKVRGVEINAWLKQLENVPVWMQIVKIKSAKTQARFNSPRFLHSTSTTFQNLCNLESAIFTFMANKVAEASVKNIKSLQKIY